MDKIYPLQILIIRTRRDSRRFLSEHDFCKFICVKDLSGGRRKFPDVFFSVYVKIELKIMGIPETVQKPSSLPLSCVCSKQPRRENAMYRCVFALLIVLTLASAAFADWAAPAAAPGQAVNYTPVFLPRAGQGPEQQDRDRYECHNWAVRQTGFDPYQPGVPQYNRMAVVPVPPAGHDTAVLGFTGALMGALAAGPRNAGAGALVGGITGAFIGAVSDSARQERAREIEEAYNRNEQARNAQFDRRMYDYRRAISACLEGREYDVR